MHKVVYSKGAIKDVEKIKKSGLKDKTLRLIEVVKSNPYQNPPPYEKLLGELKGLYTRRINIQHRLVYQIYEKEKVVKILSMWTHYEW